MFPYIYPIQFAPHTSRLREKASNYPSGPVCSERIEHLVGIYASHAEGFTDRWYLYLGLMTSIGFLRNDNPISIHRVCDKPAIRAYEELSGLMGFELGHNVIRDTAITLLNGSHFSS
jgi:hypothetical protein